jgi:hypothetical protein
LETVFYLRLQMEHIQLGPIDEDSLSLSLFISPDGQDDGYCQELWSEHVDFHEMLYVMYQYVYTSTPMDINEFKY